MKSAQFLIDLVCKTREAVIPLIHPNVQRRTFIVALASLFLSLGLVSTPSAYAKEDDHAGWVGTWGASPMAANSVPGSTNAGFTNQTVRHIAHISTGGDRLRVRLSNAYGTQALVIGEAHIYPSAAGGGRDYPLHRRDDLGQLRNSNFRLFGLCPGSKSFKNW